MTPLLARLLRRPDPRIAARLKVYCSPSSPVARRLADISACRGCAIARAAGPEFRAAHDLHAHQRRAAA